MLFELQTINILAVSSSFSVKSLYGVINSEPRRHSLPFRRPLSKDELKKKECQRLGIRFFIINIMSAGKQLPQILSDAFTQQIKPLILASAHIGSPCGCRSHEFSRL